MKIATERSFIPREKLKHTSDFVYQQHRFKIIAYLCGRLQYFISKINKEMEA